MSFHFSSKQGKGVCKAMKRRNSLMLAAVAAALIIGIPRESTAAPNSSPFKELKIKGSYTDSYGKHGKLRGTLDILHFASQDNKIVAEGMIRGVMTDSKGEDTSFAREVAWPLSKLAVTMEDDGTFAATTSAVEIPILHLTLGPLDLDLLGLTVHLNQVVLNVDAHTGPGQLLGNLLVALLGLLDPIAILGNLAQILDILNQILAIFG